jgi:branched-chain amino acid transport system substrate-binding protein
MNRPRTALACLMLCAAVVASVTACSSSGGSTGTAGTTGTGAAATGTTGTGATASTITIGHFSAATGAGGGFPEATDGAKAAVASINASGGVNGHPLKLDTCDTKFDPNQEAACARQMVTDKVAAVVFPQMFFPQTSLPLLQSAGIPTIGSTGISLQEFQTPSAFPLAGIPGWFYGVTASLAKNGAKKISILGINNAASQFANQTALAAVKASGLTLVNNIAVDPTTTDFASAAARAAQGGTDGVVITMSPQAAVPAIKALRAGGYKGLIASVTDIVPQASVTALGSDAEGLLLTSLLALPNDPKNASSKQFMADMAKYAATAHVDGVSYEAWAATQLFAKASATLTDFTSSAVLAAMNDLSNVDLPALGGYQVKGVTSPLAGYPRLLHTQVEQAIVKNGQIVDDGGFVDPFAALAKLKKN